MRKEIQNKIEDAIESIKVVNSKTEQLEKLSNDLDLVNANRDVEKKINAFSKDLIISDYDMLNKLTYEKKEKFLKSLSEEQLKEYLDLEAFVKLVNTITNNAMKQR